MIPDNQTNFLFLADTLPKKYLSFFTQFAKVLDDCNINFQFLPQTKDVWAVDYMPIQIDKNKFVRFVYSPKYLQSRKYLKTISDVDTICEQIGIETIKSNIMLDGGNVTRTSDKVIMTDRVFRDNPSYERKQLLKELQEHFLVDKLFLIPEQPKDFTGHSDGMVRFIDEHTIIINDYRKEKQEFKRAFEIAIHNTGLDYIKIPYNPYNNDSYDQANGSYINYLQMENTVIIPTFGFTEDQEVMNQFEQLFPGMTIATVYGNEIANDGGVLNCITWNIFK
jgi:agmatine deiminase